VAERSDKALTATARALKGELEALSAIRALEVASALLRMGSAGDLSGSNEALSALDRELGSLGDALAAIRDDARRHRV
jgi:hypothetical protein